MKNQFLASASAIGLMFLGGGGIAAAADLPVTYQAPAVAPVPSATVALWIGGYIPSGYERIGGSDDNDFKDNAFGFGGEARGVYDVSPNVAVQLEVLALGHGSTHTQGNTSEKDRGAGHIAIGGHIINRRDTWAWGGFGALTHSSHVEEEDDSQAAILGLEAAAFFGNSTIFGQIAGTWNIGETSEGTDAVKNGIFGRIGARHFFNPNTKLEGSLAFGGGEETSTSGSSEPDDWRWFQAAAEIEHKFNNPFSVFAAYGGDYVKSDEAGPWPSEKTWVHSFRVGARMSFGQQTLRDQEMYGAETFKFGQWAAPYMYHDELD